mmetsp:Transcript_9450/g.23200  ORF Transcript_9450/g.23200 Transcript_9450/m.23200 type:complete len:89 (+) Transcript_9450:917-1183(+)
MYRSSAASKDSTQNFYQRSIIGYEFTPFIVLSDEDDYTQEGILACIQIHSFLEFRSNSTLAATCGKIPEFKKMLLLLQCQHLSEKELA